MTSREGPRAALGSRWKRPLGWALALALLAVTLHWAARTIVEHQVRKRIDLATAEVCAVIDPQFPPVIKVGLLTRSVEVIGLTLLPVPGCSKGGLRVQGQLDTLLVSDVSWFGLVFRDRAVIGGVGLTIAHAWVTMVTENERALSKDPVKSASGPWSVAIGTYALHLRSATLITEAGDTISTDGNGIEAAGKDLQFVIGRETSLASLRSEHLRLSADRIAGRMAGGYIWSFEQLAFDQEVGTLDLFRTMIGPSLGLEAYSATLRYETDVIEAQLDTLHIAGFELNSAFAEGIFSMRSLRLASGRATVLRDKLLPDGRDPVKVLLSRSVRSLPQGNGVDTILVAGLDIQYRERVDRQRGYAVVPFTRIHGTVSGARHDANDTGALIIRAHAIAFGSVLVSAHLRAVIADKNDRFEISSSIGPMPFTTINGATGPLLDIKATHGRIDSVIYQMTADDRRASGVVRMSYHGLKLASGGRKREQVGNKLESLLLNSVVRNKDLRTNGVVREGRFAFERRKDRGIFNYLWSGLREGVKAELLPGALTK